MCDLCRALMSNILPYCDEIMQLLLENLGVSCTLLSAICVGNDMATIINTGMCRTIHFESYCRFTASVLLIGYCVEACKCLRVKLTVDTNNNKKLSGRKGL